MIKLRPKSDDLNPVTTKNRNTCDYFLSDDSGRQKKVCLTFFKKCIQVSNTVVYNAIKSAIPNEPAAELRGRFSTRKTTESDENFARRFIKKLPSHRSHYTASKSNRRFLNPNLNITRFYHFTRKRQIHAELVTN